MEMKGGLTHDVLGLQWLFLEQGVDALQRQCAVYSSSKQVKKGDCTQFRQFPFNFFGIHTRVCTGNVRALFHC